MSLQCTNTQAAPALRGQGVLVTLSSSEAVSKLPSIAVGQPVSMGSTANTGNVYSVDPYGVSFIVTPNNPNQHFESVEKGYLSVNELLTVTF
jgi:hypothetical protein